MSFPALGAVAMMKAFPLDHSARLVLYALANSHNRKSGRCFPSHSTIADDAGVSRNTVPRAIKSLVDAGLISIDPEGGMCAKGGSRRSDAYVLLFPLLYTEKDEESSMVDNAPKSVGPTVSDVGPMVDNVPPTIGTKPGINQEPNQESLVLENEDEPMVDFKEAVDLLWKAASDTGRKRSSKGDVETALRAAIKRGQSMERIMRGMGAYFRSEEATKADGAFQAGIHRKIQNERWAGYLDDEATRSEKGEEVTPEVQAARDSAGTLEAPSEQRQNLWMELWSQGMTWDSARGPMPGRHGCRVSDEIQRKWGATPFQAPAGVAAPVADDDDSAAFD